MSRQSIQPTYDSRDIGDAYTVEVREGDRRLSVQTTADPFVNTTVNVRGCRNALAVLRGRYRCSVHVDAAHDRIEDIFELNDDYKGERGSSRREDWDRDFNGILGDFAAVVAEHEDESWEH